jgi:hypothetical protein
MRPGDGGISLPLSTWCSKLRSADGLCLLMLVLASVFGCTSFEIVKSISNWGISTLVTGKGDGLYCVQDGAFKAVQRVLPGNNGQEPPNDTIWVPNKDNLFNWCFLFLSPSSSGRPILSSHTKYMSSFSLWEGGRKLCPGGFSRGGFLPSSCSSLSKFF